MACLMNNVNNGLVKYAVSFATWKTKNFNVKIHKT